MNRLVKESTYNNGFYLKVGKNRKQMEAIVQLAVNS